MVYLGGLSGDLVYLGGLSGLSGYLGGLSGTHDLLPACPYTSLSWPRALHQVVASLTPTDGCLEPCQAARGGLCRAPMNLCRAAYMGHGWASWQGM